MGSRIELELGKKSRAILEDLREEVSKIAIQLGAIDPRIKFTSVRLDRWTLLTGDIMAITISDSQKFTLTGQGTTKKGNPAPIDGSISYSVSDPTLLSVTVIDALTAEISAIGPLGVAQVVATGDADLGEGVKPVMGTLDVTIVAGEALNITLAPGTISEQ